jgi:hypothetical protein
MFQQFDDESTVIGCFKKMEENFINLNIVLRGTYYENAKKMDYYVTFGSGTYKFICFITNDTGIAFLDNIRPNNREIVEYKREFIGNKPKHTLVIDVESKFYCIEILDKKKDNKLLTYINFIQNKNYCDVPNEGIYCKNLDGLIKLSLVFLKSIGFVGPLYLDDDSQFNLGENIVIETLIPRLLLNKGSIYSKYGFKPTRISENEIRETVEKISEIKINGKEISKEIKEHIDNRGNFKPSMSNFIKNIRENKDARSYYHKLKSAFNDMVLNDIRTYPIECSSISEKKGTLNYKNKYMKYKKKYLLMKKYLRNV